MTIETRIIVGLDDILSVQLECVKCKAKVVRSPDVTLTLPSHCGQCGAVWYTKSLSDDPVVVKLLKLIAALRQGNDAGFNLKFEFDGKTIGQH